MKTKLACQLYSLHKSIDQDAAKAVRAAASLGFEGFEFYGNAMWDADFVKAALRDTGLQIAGWHVAVDRLTGDELERSLDFQAGIGNRAIVVPWLPVDMRDSEDAWKRTADFFNGICDAVTSRGMTLGYHNHDFEFQTMNAAGETGWDLFARLTRPEIVLQLDNGNAMAGGADPVKVLRAHPGRGRTLHLKPYSRVSGYDCMVGSDDLPWNDFFAEVKAQGATEWTIAEYESDAFGGDVNGLRIMREALRECAL